MKQLFSLLGSMKTMALLMSIFAFAIGYATFIENDYGTITSKAEVYNARWFELLLAFLTLNLIYNINKYKMFSIKKAPIFIFHLSFLIIILGAAITRFVGFEGSMHIREGADSNYITSRDTFFNVNAKVNDKIVSSSQSVYLSKKSTNTLESSLHVEGKDVRVELINYIPDVMESLKEAQDGGMELLELMVTGDGAGKPVKLKIGSYYENNSIALNFGSSKMFLRPSIDIFVEDGKLYMKHTMPLTWLKMDGGTKGEFAPSQKQEMTQRTLFGIGNVNFVLRKYYKHATRTLISNPNASSMQPEQDALEFKVSVGEKSKNVMIFGQAGRMAKEVHSEVDGVDVHISYGAKKIMLPFRIKLLEFQLDRYPGSMSPASYASEVELIDDEKGIKCHIEFL